MSTNKKRSNTIAQTLDSVTSPPQKRKKTKQNKLLRDPDFISGILLHKNNQFPTELWLVCLCTESTGKWGRQDRKLADTVMGFNVVTRSLPDLTNLRNSALIFPSSTSLLCQVTKIKTGACGSQHSGCLGRRTKMQGLPDLYSKTVQRQARKRKTKKYSSFLGNRSLQPSPPLALGGGGGAQ